MGKRIKLKHPNDIPFVINSVLVNNLIKFIWADNVDDYKERKYTKCRFSYFGDNLFYKFNHNAKILKYIKYNILSNYLTLDVNMGLDDGLLKKALLIASLDNNYTMIDLLLFKLDVNKIYFDNMTILEFATKLFRNNDNFGLIETILSFKANINRPFSDGSFFLQNFLDCSTRMTISKVTAMNKEAFDLYKEEKMEEFYKIFFEYGVTNIDDIVYSTYIPELLKYNPDITFKDYQYLIPRYSVEFIKNLYDQI